MQWQTYQTQGLGRTNERKNTYYSLNDKDERDIAKEVEQMLADLDSGKAHAFNEEPMDEETKRLFAISLENSLRLAREMAKNKYTSKNIEITNKLDYGGQYD
ncbi:hypothetical protein D3C73_1330920 [compost metagenome]